MVVRPAEVASELKTLRKGRGVEAPQIGDRTGPALREVCSISSDDSAAEIRRKLVNSLERLALKLPEDLRLAVLAALAISLEARDPFYQDRIRWVARKLERDERTARRRVDTGILRLAEYAAASVAGTSDRPDSEKPQPTWRVEAVRSIVLPYSERPEAIDTRLIVVEAEVLDVLDLEITVPGNDPAAQVPGDLEIEVLHGGLGLRTEMVSRDRFAFKLQLPKPLHRGDSHEYTLRYRPVSGRMRPHYVWISKLACEYFDLRVRFDHLRLPEKILKVDGAFQRDVDDPMSNGQPVEADASGDVRVEFHRLTSGLAYGLRWQE